VREKPREYYVEIVDRDMFGVFEGSRLLVLCKKREIAEGYIEDLVLEYKHEGKA